MISYSTDGDQTWRLTSAPEQTDSLTLPTDFLPAGQHISFRIWSADEFSFSEQHVDNLVAPNRLPKITLIEPLNGTMAKPGTLWRLRVQASDIDNEELEGGTWVSSRYGTLGTGTTLENVVLSPGTHTLTYTVSDTTGSSASVSTTVTVGTISAVDLIFGEDALTVSPSRRSENAQLPISLTP